MESNWGPLSSSDDGLYPNYNIGLIIKQIDSVLTV